MKSVATTVMIFLFFGSSTPAQWIFVPFKGEREVTKSVDIPKDLLNISKFGKPCGDFLLFEVVPDTDGSHENILSFMVPAKPGDKGATTYFNRYDLRIFDVQIDNSKLRPTAEWQFSPTFKKIFLRLSQKDYDAAACLRIKS